VIRYEFPALLKFDIKHLIFRGDYFMLVGDFSYTELEEKQAAEI